MYITITITSHASKSVRVSLSPNFTTKRPTFPPIATVRVMQATAPQESPSWEWHDLFEPPKPPPPLPPEVVAQRAVWAAKGRAKRAADKQRAMARAEGFPPPLRAKIGRPRKKWAGEAIAAPDTVQRCKRRAASKALPDEAWHSLVDYAVLLDKAAADKAAADKAAAEQAAAEQEAAAVVAAAAAEAAIEQAAAELAAAEIEAAIELEAAVIMAEREAIGAAMEELLVAVEKREAERLRLQRRLAREVAPMTHGEAFDIQLPPPLPALGDDVCVSCFDKAHECEPGCFGRLGCGHAVCKSCLGRWIAKGGKPVKPYRDENREMQMLAPPACCPICKWRIRSSNRSWVAV